jgi:hypothetical protein
VRRGKYPVPAARCIVLCPSLPGEITLAGGARATSRAGEHKRETATRREPATIALGQQRFWPLTSDEGTNDAPVHSPKFSVRGSGKRKKDADLEVRRIQGTSRKSIKNEKRILLEGYHHCLRRTSSTPQFHSSAFLKIQKTTVSSLLKFFSLVHP